MDLIGSQLLVLGAIASAVFWKCGSEASSWLGQCCRRALWDVEDGF